MSARCEEEVLQVNDEAAQGEAAYLRLRHALVTECEEAERLHEDLLEEQAEQRRKLVEQLAEVGGRAAGVKELGGLEELMDETRLSDFGVERRRLGACASKPCA